MVDKVQPYEITDFDSKAQNKGELVQFLGRLFPNYTEANWDWEFGNAKVLLATYENKVIGHYASLFFPFYLNGKKIEGAKAEGSLVDMNVIRRLPRGSDRRVFINLVKSYLETTPYSLTFGFPTKEATPGQTKAGYSLKEIAITPVVMLCSTHQVIKKILKSEALSKMVSQILDVPFHFFLKRRLSPKVVKASQKENSQLEAFIENLSSHHKNTLLTDKSWEFLNWKYHKNPFNEGEVFVLKGNENRILGVIGCSFFEENGFRLGCISEASFLPEVSPGQAKELFYAARNWMISHKVSVVELWSTEDEFSKSILKIAESSGFRFKKKPFTRNIILSSKNEISLDALIIPITHCFKRF